MKVKKLIASALLSVALASCGGSTDKSAEEEVKPATNALDALVQAGEAMEKAATEGDEKMKARRAKGDTVAMPYAELQKFLPKIDGYNLEGDPNGATMNMGAASYSSADATYKKGDSRVKVTIVDYNQAYAMYSAATAMWAMGMSVDTPTEKAGGIKLSDEVAGWEVFQKQNKKANVTLGVGSRFWVNIEADDQESTDFVKSVAKSLDLSKLSSL